MARHASASISLSAGASATTTQVASQLSDGPLVGGLTQFDDVESSESPFTFSVAPRYEIGKSASIYGRVATGFRPGGPNVLPPGAPADVPRTYDSDRLTNYELGLKTGGGAADKFSLDLSAFYLDWEDVQLFAGGERLRHQRQRRHRREQGPRVRRQPLSDERPHVVG